MKYAIALYDGEIAYTDQCIGVLLAKLKELSLYDNTLIVVLADHGEEFNEHGKMAHGEHLYDESIRVPLIIKLPECKRGSIVQGSFPLIDLLPSVTKYIHCDTSALGFQGTAVPLDGLQSVRETYVYSETYFHNAQLQCLRGDTSKLIVDMESKRSEVYDLKNDPGEKRNTAADSTRTSSALESLLKSVNARIDNSLKDTVSRPLSDQEQMIARKSMRALGYLQ